MKNLLALRSLIFPRFTVSLRGVLIFCLIGLQSITVMAVVVLITLTTEKALVRQSKVLLEEAGTRVASDVRRFLAPAPQAINLSARLVENGVLDAQNDAEIEDHLFRILHLTKQIAGFYFARPDGSFVYVMRSADAFRTKIIRADQTGAQLLWRDAGYNILRRQFDPNDTYDPRQRPWYSSALGRAGVAWTDPYTFFTAQSPGITVSVPVILGGKFIGVFGIDIEIQALNSMLADHAGSHGAASLILTQKGQIIAHSSMQVTGVNQPLDRLSNLPDPIAQQVFAGLGTENHDATAVQVDDHVAVLVPILGLDLLWYVGLYAAHEEFIGEIRTARSTWLWVVFGVLLGSSGVAVFLADRIGRPLVEFTRAYGRVSQQENLGSLRAPYRELAGTEETLLREIGRRRKFEAAYARTFQLSSRAMARIDPKTGQFLHVNKVMLALFNLDSNWIVSHGLHDVIQVQDHDKIDEFYQAMDSDQDYSVEVQMATPRSNPKWLRLSAVLIRDEMGAPDHALAIFDDIESARQEQNKIVQLQRDLHHVGRINAMGEFASSLAHELNQPLAALAHDLDTSRLILQQDDFDRAELAQLLVEMENQAYRAGEIIRGLRNIVRKERGRLADFDLCELVYQTLALLLPEARDAKIEIQNTLHGGLMVHANRTQVAQIILNLVRNSLDALQKHPNATAKIVVSAQSHDQTVDISVQDNGPGFASGKQPFTKFETNKDDGLGLGLSICKSLVKINNASIAYKPVTPHGACFIVTLEKARRH